MHQSVDHLLSAIDSYLRSKTNIILSVSTGSALAVADTSQDLIIKMGTQDSINWLFVMKIIGAVYIVMQIAHMVFRFYKYMKGE